ncbi:MAG: YeeE/YedE family protein [Perlucidibaca sp.]
MKGLAAFLVGLLFGLGLVISGMTDPARVQGFLDLAGDWDATLMFVMGGAVLVTLPAFAWFRRLGRPVLEERFGWPSARQVDVRLIAGAAMFGAGWGLAGLCPGPALVNLATGHGGIITFCVAMVAGMLLHDRVLKD